MTAGPRDAARSAADASVSRVVARLQEAGGGANADASRVAALAARLLHAPHSMLSLVADAAHTVGSAGLPPDAPSELPLTDSLCAATVEHGAAVRIDDAATDPDLARFGAVRRGEARSYLGVPLRAPEGGVIGALCVFGPDARTWSDADAEILAELGRAAVSELELAALARDYERSRTRWDLAIAAAGVGTFDWDLASRRLVWDATLIELFGYDGDERFDESIEAFVARLHPDDVPRVEQAMTSAIAGLAEYEAEYRVVLPNGTVRQVQARGRALGTDGRAQRLVGAAWDVTRTRGLEDRAARILETMPVGYLSLTPDGVVTAVNNVAERLLWQGRNELIGASLRTALPAPAGDTLADLVGQVVLGGELAGAEIRLSQDADTWLAAQVSPETGGVAIYVSDVTDRRRARETARRAAEHDRAVATALQDAMLTRLPEPDHLQVDARYRPAAAQDKVGGDWYDAISQPDGALTVVVGDVVGHDIAAAAVMGQLRSTLRGFLWQDDAPPSAQLHRLDRAMCALYPGALATVVTARIEQTEQDRAAGRRRLRWSAAGHPPPLLIDPDGTVTVLHARSDVMLGVFPDAPRRDHEVEVAPGALLLLYTDGLIERRGEDIDVGLARLVAAVERHAGEPLPRLLDLLTAETVSQATDDVVVLGVRFGPEDVPA